MVEVPFAMSAPEVPYTLAGPFNTTQVVTITWTGVTVNAPCGTYGYAVESTAGASTTPPEARFSISQGVGSITYTLDQPTPSVSVIPFTDRHCSSGTLHGVTVTVTGSAGHCQYGTERKDLGTFIYYVTPGLIDVALAELGAPWLAPLFTGSYFTTINAETLCGSGPPPIPTIDLTTLQASAVTVLQILEAVLWPHLCQCKAGTPPAPPYPIPNPAQPTGWPAPLVFDCSNVDVCATLISLQKQITAMQATLGEDLGLTTLLQRYGLPFATVRGAVHSNLSGTGTFAVSRLVGLELELLTVPPAAFSAMGNPPYIYNLGWASIMSDDGMIDEHRFTRSKASWFSKLMPMATSFGWSLTDGCVMTVTELEAEV